MVFMPLQAIVTRSFPDESWFRASQSPTSHARTESAFGDAFNGLSQRYRPEVDLGKPGLGLDGNVDAVISVAGLVPDETATGKPVSDSRRQRR